MENILFKVALVLVILAAAAWGLQKLFPPTEKERAQAEQQYAAAEEKLREAEAKAAAAEAAAPAKKGRGRKSAERAGQTKHRGL